MTGDTNFTMFYQGGGDYIEANGVNVYTLTVHAAPTHLQQLLSDEQIIPAKLEDVTLSLQQ